MFRNERTEEELFGIQAMMAKHNKKTTKFTVNSIDKQRKHRKYVMQNTNL